MSGGVASCRRGLPPPPPPPPSCCRCPSPPAPSRRSPRSPSAPRSPRQDTAGRERGSGENGEGVRPVAAPVVSRPVPCVCVSCSHPLPRAGTGSRVPFNRGEKKPQNHPNPKSSVTMATTPPRAPRPPPWLRPACAAAAAHRACAPGSKVAAPLRFPPAGGEAHAQKRAPRRRRRKGRREGRSAHAPSDRPAGVGGCACA